MSKKLETTSRFMELIRDGLISQDFSSDNIENMRFPGELPYFHTIATYGTTLPANSGGVVVSAKLVQHS